MEKQSIKNLIEKGTAVLGIEFGSTRIKAVLIDSQHNPIAQGAFEWENRLENGVWTYHTEDIWKGLQSAYSSLCEDVKNKYDTTIHRLSAIGISAMMHGYIPLDKNNNLLVPFRTWRNTSTSQACEILTEKFNFNIPLRWSISHLYQAILSNEEHVTDISYLTTLAGYVHLFLTGEKVLGIGDASGMFPIDSNSNCYDENMLEIFSNILCDKNFSWNLTDILPEIKIAGEYAGKLTPEGAKLLDPTGNLEAGVPLCPPEGDAGTGMTATNSVEACAGNVSAGTSIFAMIVLDKALKNVYEEIDMVTTPAGKPVAMVHCNNCTSDINAWVNIFREASVLLGGTSDINVIFEKLYNKALEGEKDCGGLISYNYLSGEPITGLEEGRPMFIRMPNSNFNVANFMRNHLYSAIAALKIGMDILTEKEQVEIKSLMGHGGLFKTEGVAGKIMAGALKTPILVTNTAGEGGAWGIALLAAYLINKKSDETLVDYLAQKVFNDYEILKYTPNNDDTLGFEKYMDKYKKGLEVQKSAVRELKL